MAIADELMELSWAERIAWLQDHPEEQTQLRRDYLALDQQGRADLLYRLRIGGAALSLAPHQYPNVQPHRRSCICGGEAELITGYQPRGFYGPELCYVRCKTCGLRTDFKTMPVFAWEDWEDGKFVLGEELRLW